MKKSMYLLMLTVFLYSCTNDQNDFITNEEQQLTTTSKSDQLSSKNSGKVLICHNTGDGFVTIEVNANAVNAHYKHGDINPDSDGDGFTAKYGPLNPCELGDGTDCDDTNPEFNSEEEWYLDSDGDQYAVSKTVSCASPGVGYTLTVLPLGDLDDNDPIVQDVVVEQNCFYANGVGNYSGTTNSIYGDVLSNLVVSLDNGGNYILTGTLTFKSQISPVDYEETVYDIYAIFGDNWNDGPGGLISPFSMLTIDNNPASHNGSGSFNCNNYSLSLYISFPGYYGGAIQANKN